jgi:hypothetical protein
MNAAPEFTLHCDDCHHEVDYLGKMTAEHIGTPCPICGSDMLTEADYKVGRRVQVVMAILAFFGLARKVPRDDSDAHVSVHHHAGKTTVSRLR